MKDKPQLTREGIIKLQEKGRYDLILIAYINLSGFAGLLSTGEIVDRRFFPEAHPISENALFKLPQPKIVVDERGDLASENDYELAKNKLKEFQSKLPQDYKGARGKWLIHQIKKYERG